MREFLSMLKTDAESVEDMVAASRLQPDYVLMSDRLLSVELKAERATPIRG